MNYPESKSSGEMESTKWKPYHFVMNNGQAILMEDCMFSDWRIAAEKLLSLLNTGCITKEIYRAIVF